MNNNETTKCSYHFRIFLKDIFGFAKHLGNCSYGLGYRLTLQRPRDNHVLSHLRGATDAANLALAGRVIIDDIIFCVPHHAPNTSNQNLMLGHIESKAATELSYIKRSSDMKDVTTGNN